VGSRNEICDLCDHCIVIVIVIINNFDNDAFIFCSYVLSGHDGPIERWSGFCQHYCAGWYLINRADSVNINNSFFDNHFFYSCAESAGVESWRVLGSCRWESCLYSTFSQ
jgi:hypothetical protein